MATFLLAVWPLETHIWPNVAVARALRNRGHQIAFLTGEEYRATVEAEGFRFFPFEKIDQALIHRLLTSLMEEWNKPLRARKLWRQFLLDTVPDQIADMESVITRWPVQVVVSDMAMWGSALVVSAKRPVPTAILCHVGYCLLPGQSGIHPGVGGVFGLGGWAKLRARLASRIIQLGTRGIQRGLSDIRVANGVPALTSTPLEETGNLPLYLIPSSPELDYQRTDLPRSVQYVGPCLAGPDGHEGLHRNSSPVPVEGENRAVPRVLLTEGSNHIADPWLMKMALAGLDSSPMQVVAIAGKYRAAESLRTPTQKVGIVDWRPEEGWDAKVDAVVTGGSSEIVLPALAHGVPLVLAPSVLEESAMARRVADFGAGISIPRKRCSPRTIREAVERVLGDESYGLNARRAAETFRKCGGPDRAAALLEDLADSGN